MPKNDKDVSPGNKGHRLGDRPKIQKHYEDQAAIARNYNKPTTAPKQQPRRGDRLT